MCWLKYKYFLFQKKTKKNSLLIWDVLHIITDVPMFTIFYYVEFVQYSTTCVRQPPLKLTLAVDVERWLSYKGTCLAKLHDMYFYKTDNVFHINHYLKSVSKVALLHRFYCTNCA